MQVKYKFLDSGVNIDMPEYYKNDPMQYIVNKIVVSILNLIILFFAILWAIDFLVMFNAGLNYFSPPSWDFSKIAFFTVSLFIFKWFVTDNLLNVYGEKERGV